MAQIDPHLINAAHRAEDFTNKTGQRAYVYYCDSAKRYEVLLDYPVPSKLSGEYRLIAISGEMG